MKKFLTAALLSLPMMSTADILTEDIPVCRTLTHLEQALRAKERYDTRAMRYLIEKDHCFYAGAGTEYSVIDVNYPEDPSDWAKIRAYGSEGTVELYTWYGFVK